MIEWFKGVILIDGIVKEGLDLTRLAHNNVMMVDADLSTRINRIRERYVWNWDNVSDEYIQSMIDKQPTKECIKNMLDTSITQESNGSMQYVQNTHTPNTRAVLFKMLNQIDRYGEIRAIWILSKLGIQWNMSDHLNFLQSRYNEQHRYYHSWEHIVESLKWLFEIAIALNLDDSIIARIGGAILWHDLVYVVNELQYSTNESNSARVWGEYLKKYGASSEDLEIIDDLIKETRHGRVSIPEKLISHVMHDVDMAILGAQSSRYQQYARDIRQEFMPMKSGVEFEKLRFEAFLSKVWDAFKYKTNYFQDMIGSRVSGNIKWEVGKFSR